MELKNDGKVSESKDATQTPCVSFNSEKKKKIRLFNILVMCNYNSILSIKSSKQLAKKFFVGYYKDYLERQGCGMDMDGSHSYFKYGDIV